MNQNKKISDLRSKGRFFTKGDLSNYIYRTIMSKIKFPEVLIEPFVGEGSLIKPFLEQNIRIIVNDIILTDSLTKIKNNEIEIYNRDFISINTDEIINKWIKNTNLNILLYSNPPFGTKSTNALSSKLNELNKTKSRKIAINYGGLGPVYGKGDIILPALGKMIEVIISYENGYLAFFSPLGVFCGRKRYNKLLLRLLKNFKFIYGEIFSGLHFNNVNKNKPISFTLWKFEKDTNSRLENLEFFYEEKVIPLKKDQLLKDFWKYDNRKYVKGEIVVQGNDRFNVQAPKMMHVNVKKGGSELIPENVKRSFNIDGLPDELIIGLWSLAVGHRSITSYPIYVDNAHVHLPDFSRLEYQELLSYIALYSLIYELGHDYCKGKVFLDYEKRQIIFGGLRLSKGINYLLSKFKNSKISSFSIQDILNILFSKSFNDIDVSLYKKEIKVILKNQLELLGYYKFIPIPHVINP